MRSCDCSSAAAEPPPDARASNALCPNREPPRVAVCVVGGARTFPQEQGWRSLKRHLVEGLGGVGLGGASAPDVFIDLKLIDDAPKTQREWKFDALSRRLDDRLCTAACAFRPVALSINVNDSHAGSSQPRALERGCFRSGFFGHRENFMRAVSQWSSFAACHESLVAHEARHGSDRGYDLVVLTRPDTVWYQPVRPFCMHALRETTVIHRGPYAERHRTTAPYPPTCATADSQRLDPVTPGPPRWNSTLEWLMLMPRKHASAILTTASVFESCEPGKRCCGISRSEDLLSLALSRAGRWRHEPFGVDILRGAQHATMRNAGCMQPETLGFDSFERCRQVVYGLPDGAPVVAPARAAHALKAPPHGVRAASLASRAPPQHQQARSSPASSSSKRDHHHGGHAPHGTTRRPPHSGR